MSTEPTKAPPAEPTLTTPDEDGRVLLYQEDGTEVRVWPVDAADAIRKGKGSLSKPEKAAAKPAPAKPAAPSPFTDPTKPAPAKPADPAPAPSPFTDPPKRAEPAPKPVSHPDVHHTKPKGH